MVSRNIPERGNNEHLRGEVSGACINLGRAVGLESDDPSMRQEGPDHAGPCRKGVQIIF